MPISLSIGLSRKVSKDYNSRGYSVNLDVELPADAINDQQSIADSADRLFALCDQLLDRQIADQATPKQATNNRSHRPPGRQSQDRDRYTKRSISGGRKLTNAQERAISNMARKLGEDGDSYAQHEYGTPLNALTVKQASELIDVLKAEIESRQGAAS